jgi:ATP-dependent DNA helicase RecG
MNIEQLIELVKQGESQRLEFKKSTGQLKPAFETTCAFLNGKGGVILFGVKDDGQIIGQQVADQTKQDIAHELKKIEPYAPIEIHYIPIKNDHQIIMIEVPEGKHTPYAYDGRPYERNQSTTERMTQHRYEQLIIQRAHLNHNWEEFLTDEYTIDDLDHDEIRKTIEEGIHKNRISPEAANYSVEQILKNLKLIKDNKLTNAAVVLFAKDSEKIFSRCEIKMARFRGRDKLEGFIDNQWERGNAFQLIALAHHFTSRHLPIASFFEAGKIQRIDQPAVPQLALREALTNAFCHRDYSVKSATTSLAIYDDRLELWNPGCLLPELKIAQLKEPHNSYQRNELIAHVFYKRGWIEKWGTGTTRMVEYCRKNSTPEPEFSEDSCGFTVLFPFKESMNSGIVMKTTSSKHQLTQRQKEIITILEVSGETSLREIIRQLNNPPAERTVREDMTILKKLKIIDSHGLSRATTWFIVK